MEPAWSGIVAPELHAAATSGPYHLVLDSTGGSALSAALTMLEPRGTCGGSESSTATFESGMFFRQDGVSLYGLILFHELKSALAGPDLALLANEIANGRSPNRYLHHSNSPQPVASEAPASSFTLPSLLARRKQEGGRALEAIHA